MVDIASCRLRSEKLLLITRMLKAMEKASKLPHNASLFLWSVIRNHINGEKLWAYGWSLRTTMPKLNKCISGNVRNEYMPCWFTFNPYIYIYCFKFVRIFSSFHLLMMVLWCFNSYFYQHHCLIQVQRYEKSQYTWRNCITVSWESEADIVCWFKVCSTL